MKRSTIKYCLLLPLAAGLASSNTDGCLDNQNALPKAGLFSSSTGKAITLNNIEISGVGAPGDSILVTAGTTVGEVYLPMRSTKHSTSWRFCYTQQGLEGIEDIVTFDYDSEPYFASADCGAMYNYRIRRCTTTYNLIDSVGVADSLITNVDLLRIKIYIRTATTPPETDE